MTLTFQHEIDKIVAYRRLHGALLCYHDVEQPPLSTFVGLESMVRHVDGSYSGPLFLNLVMPDIIIESYLTFGAPLDHEFVRSCHKSPTLESEDQSLQHALLRITAVEQPLLYPFVTIEPMLRHVDKN